MLRAAWRWLLVGLDDAVLRATLLGALLLRVGLAFVNRQANDDHVEVVRWMLEHGRLPFKGDCWECYQPKLYHLAVAGIVRLFGLHEVARQTIAGQLVNVALGAATLLLFARFLRRLPLDAIARRALFAALAFQPRLLSTHVQATNDALVILAGLVTSYACWRFAEKPGARRIAWITIGAVIGGLAKGSGFVIFAWALLVLGVLAIRRRGRSDAAALGILAVSFASVVPFAGPYVEHWRRFGDPFVLNIPKDPPASFREVSVVRRPGVLSYSSAFLSFRPASLWRDPYTPHSNENVPTHRTSLASQLYGQHASLWFTQWPETWARRDGPAENTTRALLVLELVPLALLLCGAVLTFRRPGGWMFLALAVAFLGMQLRLSTTYRDFSVMKAIYLYPALLAPVYWMAAAIESLPIGVRRASIGLLWLLAGVSALEAIELLAWLLRG